MPKDHSQLLPGHLVVGTEPAVIIAGDQPLLPGPEDGVGIGVVQVHIGERTGQRLVLLVQVLVLLRPTFELFLFQGHLGPVIDLIEGGGDHGTG